MKNYKNNYEVNDILGTNKVRVVVEGEWNQSYNVDSYVFHQQLGTFLNSDDEYRVNWLENNAERHCELKINPCTL